MFNFTKWPLKNEIRNCLEKEMKIFLERGGQIKRLESTFEFIMKSHKTRYSRTAQAIAARKKDGIYDGMTFKKWYKNGKTSR